MSSPNAADPSGVNEARALTELDKLYFSSANKQISLLMHFHDGDQKQVVRSMLDTLVEGQFHKEMNCTIRSEAHISMLLFGLLPRLAPSLQSPLIDTLADMIERHFRNAESCRRVSVTRHLVTLLTSSRLLDRHASSDSNTALKNAGEASAAEIKRGDSAAIADGVESSTFQALSDNMSPSWSKALFDYFKLLAHTELRLLMCTIFSARSLVFGDPK